MSYLPSKTRAQTAGPIKRKHLNQTAVPVVLDLLSALPLIVLQLFLTNYFLCIFLSTTPFFRTYGDGSHYTRGGLADHSTSKSVAVESFLNWRKKEKKRTHFWASAFATNAVITSKAEIARTHILIFTILCNTTIRVDGCISQRCSVIQRRSILSPPPALW